MILKQKFVLQFPKVKSCCGFYNGNNFVSICTSNWWLYNFKGRSLPFLNIYVKYDTTRHSCKIHLFISIRAVTGYYVCKFYVNEFQSRCIRVSTVNCPCIITCSTQISLVPTPRTSELRLWSRTKRATHCNRNNM